MSKRRNNYPLVTVAILNWNGIDDTLKCIDSVKKSVYKGILEIIVLDNGSTNNSVDRLREIKGITLLENKSNRGFAGGHVDILGSASGEFILVLNNDTVISHNYIDKAVEIMQSDASIGAVGGRSYSLDGDSLAYDTANNFYGYQQINQFNAEGRFVDDQSHGYIIDVNNVSGSSVMISRTAIDKVGYFEPRFFAYYEESDLFARMKRGGLRVVYSADLAIWHKNGASSANKSSSFRTYMLFRNRVMFAVRNFSGERLFKSIIFFLILSLKMLKKSITSTDEDFGRREARAALRGLLVSLTVMLPRSLIENRELKKKLGKSDYADIIATEQAKFSYVFDLDSNPSIIDLKNSWEGLPKTSEMIVVSSSVKLFKAAKKVFENEGNIRFIFNKKYFDCSALNLGLSVSNSEFVVVGYGRMDGSVFNRCLSATVKMARSGKNMTIFSYAEFSRNAWKDYAVNDVLVIRRAFLVDSLGFDSSYGNDSNAKRLLILKSASKDKLCVLPALNDSHLLPSFEIGLLGKYKTADIIEIQYRKSKNSKLEFKIIRRLSNILKLEQIKDGIGWTLTKKIGLRHKLGRLKNILRYMHKRRVTLLRVEMKHIRNEYLRVNGRLNINIPRSFDKLRKISAENYNQIPIFIICRDRLDDLKRLISWFEEAGMTKVVFIDNDSAYPPLLEYLQNTSYQVIGMGYNAGHQVAWKDGLVPLLCPREPYILTDPDVLPCKPGKIVMPELIKALKRNNLYSKVGLALKIDDLPDHYELKDEVNKWESQFWNNKIAPNLYEAGVDTTFALYRQGIYDYVIHPALRIAGDCEARHMPWYKDLSKPSKEDLFYRLHAESTINSWAGSELPERYKKEMKKIGL